jgi:predicted RNA-binding protein
VDSSRLLLDSARGLFHTADGVGRVEEAERKACGCPACESGGDLRAHNDRALQREMLLVRNHLIHGRLRELVERRLANAPWNTAVIRHLDLRGYDLVEPYTPVAGGEMLAFFSCSRVRRGNRIPRVAATDVSAKRSWRAATRPSCTRSLSHRLWV